jgi:hypothetical protein
MEAEEVDLDTAKGSTAVTRDREDKESRKRHLARAYAVV